MRDEGGLISEFLHMGGYGAYIWPAYGISILVLIGMVAFTLRAYRKERAALSVLEQDKSAGEK